MKKDEGYIHIVLTENEMQFANDLAHKRNDPKEMAGVKTKYLSRKSTLDQHLCGTRSELAVAKLLGLKMDATFSLSGDGGHSDLVMPSGKTVQVKYRERVGWDYAIGSDNPKDFKDDYGVLVYPDKTPNSFIIAGVITREEFEEKATVTNYGYGPRLRVGPESLHPIRDPRTQRRSSTG